MYELQYLIEMKKKYKGKEMPLMIAVKVMHIQKKYRRILSLKDRAELDESIAKWTPGVKTEIDLTKE